MKNIIKIIIAILLIYFGNKLNKSNAGASSQSIIEKYENFCSNGEIIFATIDNEYLETTYGNKIEIKIFEFKINYNYKGENYSQKITQNLKPEKTEVKITVLKSDGNKFVKGDTCEQVKMKKDNPKNSTLEYIGIFMIIIGVLFLFSSIKKLFGVPKKTNYDL